ncbi:IS3 family transposase [Aliarcobacter cryaerophilus]|uniref:IS3 family transposase n=1 Tax=Aliarcobacter cryaerophilus TaxID=28198 RepID=UPI003DA1DF22
MHFIFIYKLYQWYDDVNIINTELNNLVKNIFEHSCATYGTRRLKEVLKQRYGLIVSRRKLQRTLKNLNLKIKMKRRFKVITTTSNHTLPISPNHLNINIYS